MGLLWKLKCFLLLAQKSWAFELSLVAYFSAAWRRTSPVVSGSISNFKPLADYLSNDRSIFVDDIEAW